MNEDMWIASCTECAWENYSFVSHGANRWADAHTEETGHKATVEEYRP